MPDPDRFDLLVLGAGSAGVRASRLAAQRGLATAVVEAAPVGGTCVNLGCIPKKLYSFAAHYSEAFEEARGFGWHTADAPAFDWDTLKTNRRAEIARLNRIYESVLSGAGATLLRGRGRLLDARRVEVDGSVVEAERIVVATGGRAVLPPIVGAELAVVSDAMFDLPSFPSRLVVIGGGYIACEFASIFRGLGAEVTLVHRGERLLRGFDADVQRFVAEEMAKKGIAIRLGAGIEAIRATADGRAVDLVDGTSLPADAVLAATGRVPNTQGLGLAEAGVRLSASGAVHVDDAYRTTADGVYAIGDVIDRVQLTPVALAEAMVVVDALTGRGTRTLDYDRVPTAVFTHPPVGTVGCTEAAARARGGAVRVYRSEFRPLRHTVSGSSERTMVKMVVDDATDRVLGLHMVGAEAGEIVQGFAVAMTAGVTKAQVDATLGIHPTVAEEFVTMREPLPPSMA